MIHFLFGVFFYIPISNSESMACHLLFFLCYFPFFVPILKTTDQFMCRIAFNKDNNAPSSPPRTLSAKQNHVPSLSPINSSTESTPTSDSPPMKFKSNTNDFFSGSKAKSILSSVLNNKNGNKQFVFVFVFTHMEIQIYLSTVY